MTLRKQQRLLAAATAPATPNHQLVCLVKAMIEARPMSPGELVKVIGEVQGALKLKPRTEPRKPTTAEILASIKPYGLMSFENGKTYTMLKRHLAHHGLTVAAYKEKVGIAGQLSHRRPGLQRAPLQDGQGPGPGAQRPAQALEIQQQDARGGGQQDGAATSRVGAGAPLRCGTARLGRRPSLAVSGGVSPKHETTPLLRYDG